MPRFLKVRIYDGRLLRLVPAEIAAIVEHMDVTKRDSQCHVFMKGANGRDEERFDVVMPAEALAELVEQFLAKTKEGHNE